MQSQNRGLYEVLNGSEYCQDRVAEARTAFVPLIERLLARAQADGHVRSDLEASDLTDDRADAERRGAHQPGRQP